jgi:hypothetical protein
MEESMRCFLATLAYVGLPESMIDLGCGNGHLVRLAASLGISSFGIDNNLPRDDKFKHGSLLHFDLMRFKTLKKYDLVICWEVGEHLVPKAADILCDLLFDVTKRTLIFTAAKKNQGGSGHFNEQPPEYWRQKLESRGLIWQQLQSSQLSQIWEIVAPNAWWYSQNCQVFSCKK